MDMGNLSRRGFLQRSLTTLALAGLPAWYAREVLADREEKAVRKQTGPNDKIQLGVIGSGDRFRGGLLGDVRRHKDFQVVALADVDAHHRDDCDSRIKPSSRARAAIVRHSLSGACSRKRSSAMIRSSCSSDRCDMWLPLSHWY